MAKYKVEYSVNDPTGSGAGYKSSRTIEAKSADEAKQLFKQKHAESARNRVTNNVSSTQLGSQNPRVTVRDVYDLNKGKDPKNMTKMQREAAESNKRIQKQMAAIKPTTKAGKKFYGKAGGGGSRSADGVTEIFPKMLVRPNLRRK